jgi:hypothetical protein
VPPNPSDLERPAPNEPVRIQPPAPKFAKGSRPTERDGTKPASGDESARTAEMERERRRLRNDPERRRAGERPSPDVNRWVHQRANKPRAGLWQTHGHSMRGR